MKFKKFTQTLVLNSSLLYMLHYLERWGLIHLITSEGEKSTIHEQIASFSNLKKYTDIHKTETACNYSERPFRSLQSVSERGDGFLSEIPSQHFEIV